VADDENAAAGGVARPEVPGVPRRARRSTRIESPSKYNRDRNPRRQPDRRENAYTQGGVVTTTTEDFCEAIAMLNGGSDVG
jgi:hypothetical protein